MKASEAQFLILVNSFSSSDPDIALGKMMNSPGLKYKDNVFAFFYKGAMGFRLGPDFDPDKFGLTSAWPLNPFKSRPPLVGWFLVDKYESYSWGTLATMALECTRNLEGDHFKTIS